MAGGADDGRPPRVLGLLVDPGLPADLARHLAGALPRRLAAEVDGAVIWEVRTVHEPFEVTTSADRVIDRARQRVEGTRWDVAVCLTDIPLPSADGIVVAEVSRSDRVALLSVPALGGLRLRARTRDVVLAVVAAIETPATGGDDPPGPLRARAGPASPGLARTARPSAADIDLELVMPPGRRGRLRLLAGTVRANQPWQLALGLSTALAAAATGSVFGILYSTVWELAVALAPWRIALATAGAVAVFVLWLIVGHDLWDRAPRSGPLGRLQNTGTAVTVAAGALTFYAALVVINLTAAATLIPPDYLGEILARPVGPGDYLRIALMASLLGLVAGAVGSGLEDDATVRRAASGTREQQRRRQVGA